MRILLLTPNTPGLASNHLVKYLKSQSEHTFTHITHPVAPAAVRRKSTFGEFTILREPVHMSLASYALDMGLSLVGTPLTGKYDYAICITAHLALSALILKKFGIVKHVVYWALDYYEQRYGEGGVLKAKGLESIYRNLEKTVVRNADVLWTITPNMFEGWESGNYTWQAPIRTVPHLVSDISKSLPIQDRHGFIFSGNLSGRDEFGFEGLMEAWTLAKSIAPELNLTVTSRTKIHPKYQEFLNREDVSCPGFIENNKDFRTLVASHKAGISPYPEGTYKKYSDVAGIKLFISCGLPVVTTPASYTAIKIKDSEAGIITDGSTKSLVEAILLLERSDEQLELMSQNAYDLAERESINVILPDEMEFLEKRL